MEVLLCLSVHSVDNSYREFKRGSTVQPAEQMKSNNSETSQLLSLDVDMNIDIQETKMRWRKSGEKKEEKMNQVGRAVLQFSGEIRLNRVRQD